MSVWDDPDFVADVVRRYNEGESPAAIGRSLKMTRNQVGSKLSRIGVLRGQRKSTRPRQVRRITGPYGNMASRTAIIDRARRCFRSGPLTVADIGLMLDVDSHAASGVVRRLVDLREVEKTGEQRGGAVLYRMIRIPAPTMRGQDLRRMEDAYVQARKDGSTARDLAQSMNLTQTAAEKFEAMFRAQTTSSNSFDNSCPKFAHHDRHLSALARVGTYPVMPSRPGYQMAARP